MSLLLATPAAAEIPPPIEAMIREAARGGDKSTLDTVVKIARATNPNEADAIDALARHLLAEATEKAKKEREEKLAAQSFLGGWRGEGQAGFGLTSGNTEEVSGVASLSLKKETLQTRHKFDALVDYLRTNEVTTRERLAASYAFDYLFRENLYTYGIVGWEQDRFAGYARRFTESLGGGLRAIDRPNMTLDLDAGPALRQTLFTDGTSSIVIGPRASLTYKWTLPHGRTFTEDASVVSDDDGTTIISNTAFTTKITGGLSARMSVKVQTESNRPSGAKPTDTSTRASLVFTF
jgi:putative salt-induced outer membrane protein